MNPPRIAEAIASGLVADPDLEEPILGDLREEWNERVERAGVPAARAWYWGQVLRSVPHLLSERWIHRSPEKTMTKTDFPLRHAARPLLAAALILTVPLVAMQFSAEVVWTLSDFVIMGVLVFGTGLLFELALAKTESTVYRAAAGLALAAGFLLFWVNAAVGVIGAAGNDANMMYLGVLAIGIGGAIGAGFEPRGMARAMVATTLAQLGVGAIALVGGLGGAASGPFELLALNGFFAALFLTSAWLFRRAAGSPSTAAARAAG